MAISQGSNLINVVVHNSADSRDASLGTIILSHVLIEEENCGSFLQEEPPPPAPAIHLIQFISIEASSAIGSSLARWFKFRRPAQLPTASEGTAADMGG